jgi:hypothetical protein
MRKAKYSVCAALIFCAFTFSSTLFVDAQDEPTKISWDGQDWKSTDETEYERGRIVYYS